MGGNEGGEECEKEEDIKTRHFESTICYSTDDLPGLFQELDLFFLSRNTCASSG